MEIHPPHGPIQSRKDFLVHLLTITIGILIALSLEGIVQRLDHRALVREARANLATEIRENQQTLKTALEQIRANQAICTAALGALHQLRENRNANIHQVRCEWSGVTLRAASWNAVVASGALSYMPYPELKVYTDLYDNQHAAALVQQQLLLAADLSAFENFGYKMDSDRRSTLTDVELQEPEAAVARFLMRLTTLEQLYRSLDEGYRDFLAKASLS